MKAGLSVHNRPAQGAGRVAVAAPIGRVLSLLTLRAAGAPSGKGRVLREEIEAMLVDVISQTPWLAKHSIVHEVVVSIAELSIWGEIWDRRIPTG